MSIDSITSAEWDEAHQKSIDRIKDVQEIARLLSESKELTNHEQALFLYHSGVRVLPAMMLDQAI